MTAPRSGRRWSASWTPTGSMALRSRPGGGTGAPTPLARTVKWVKQATAPPPNVKLSPNEADILPVARAAVEAGAEGFTATSGLSALGGIDSGTLVPLPVQDPAHMG